jgi:hypothetical protein
MAMTRPNLYAILDTLTKELEYHSENTSCRGTECAKLKHRPYIEYCIKEIALYAGADAIVEAVRSQNAASRA